MREEALRSAEPTHAHVDGAAGAVAVAIAAALACKRHPRETLVAEVAAWTPASKTRDRLLRAHQLGIGVEGIPLLWREATERLPIA